jgi:hypothetical protein
MHRSLHTAAALAAALTTISCSSLQPHSLQLASDSAGVGDLRSIEFSGTGRWYQLRYSQRPSADLPQPDHRAWPQSSGAGRAESVFGESV